MINIAIMGYGVVGSGVADILTEQKDKLSAYVDDEINLKYILDVRDFPDSPYQDKFIKDFDTIVKDDSIDIVVETIGGATVAYDFVKSSLLYEKSVVTSNKELIAEKGSELFEIATNKRVDLLFDASVGGGIPIIKPMCESLIANKINEITGILNGTTNYILTKMLSDGVTMSEALASAQKLGYAEKDPSADIDGIDACRKICILASLMTGEQVYTADILTKGIRDIDVDDVKYAKSEGYAVKLIAHAKRLEDDSLKIVVSPMLVPSENPMSNVNDVFNAVMLNGNYTDEVMFYGKGAGSLPTASAVVADIIECAIDKFNGNYTSTTFFGKSSVKNYEDVEIRAYVMLECDNKKKTLERAEQQFNNLKLLGFKGEKENRLSFITDINKVKNIKNKLTEISKDTDCKLLSFMEVL